MALPEQDGPGRIMARIWRRRLGSLYWLTLQLAAVWMVLDPLPPAFEAAIVFVLWAHVTVMMLLKEVVLLIGFAKRSLSRRPLAQHLQFLRGLLHEDPARHLLFMAFLAALAFDARPVLLSLYLLDWAAGLVLRTQAVPPAE